MARVCIKEKISGYVLKYLHINPLFPDFLLVFEGLELLWVVHSHSRDGGGGVGGGGVSGGGIGGGGVGRLEGVDGVV